MGQVVSLSQSPPHLCLCHPVKCVMTILPSSLLPRAQAKTEKETVEPEKGEMCHSMNNCPPSPPNHVKIRTRSISMMKIVKEEQDEEEERETRPKNAPLKPKYASRKSRCRRRRKPKYLSLRSSRLSAPNDAAFASSSSAAATSDDTDSKVRNTSAAAATTTTTPAATTKKTAVRRGEQPKLFPLQTEENAAATAEADHHSDENVALLFESDGGATLHGVLTSATDNAAATTTTTSTMSSDHDQAVESSDYGYGRRSDVDIVRTAMRGTSGGGDPGVEKWICYSELVKEEVELTAAAATSSASTCCSVGDDRKSCSKQDQRLTLKLDYTEVLNAWSDKGSLYVKTDDGEEPPQTVPELLQDQLLHHLNDSTANIEDLWMVPGGVGSGSGTLDRKLQREASLLRYKRKRESRLFSKRIRYEVRKINAEKRPRIKGRFVRSSERQDIGHRSY